MKELKISIGPRMRQLRNEAGLSQAELGSKVGLEKSTISSYESGTRTPTAYTAAKIAKALGVSLDYLCAITNDRYNIRIPKEVELDLSRLNPDGLRELCSFYRYLCGEERYTEK